jgi:hypothetical protein
MNFTEQSGADHEFYRQSLELLNQSGIPFLLGGAFALYNHTGICRDTKDLDIFCLSTDYPGIMKYFSRKGYRAELYDVRWIAKLHKDGFFIDIIFSCVNGNWKVEDHWFDEAVDSEFAGVKVKIMSVEELIRQKIYIQNRERYDGADVNHLFLKCGEQIGWSRLLKMLDPHWHLLLAQVLQFQFVYPSEFHRIIPKWLFDELIDRANQQYELPPPVQKVCRGTMIDQTQYATDVKEWGYKSYTIISV